jgi:hypothetical protein
VFVDNVFIFFDGSFEVEENLEEVLNLFGNEVGC